MDIFNITRKIRLSPLMRMHIGLRVNNRMLRLITPPDLVLASGSMDGNLDLDDFSSSPHVLH